jgi:hypothetical protein
MIVDKIEGLFALEQSGIHVARCALVDSPENAIAFASRRTAQDERFVPISLRAASKSQADPDEQSLLGEAAIRAGFSRLVAKVPVARVLAQVAVECGTDVAIHVCTDERDRSFVTLRGRTHGAEQPMPLDAERARLLVDGFRDFGHKPAKAAESMLEHLLLDVAGFFNEHGIERLTLDPVRLHEGSYSVLDATMVAPRPLHVKAGLAAHAHDRKHFTPSGQQ